ncbi:unnamed protein product [Adineta steineri]|uniref:EGF-like domain-containing protein n=1 Tax=Adineta steineri TaxID=433720 RepID=A0A815CAS5_9BILA|nr:unnamed protein product [Adineta steineri]CAF1280358.1 unnamed protein product [Adineta steineri]
MIPLTDNMCSILSPGFCKNGGTCYVNNTVQYACRCPYSDMGKYCEKESKCVGYCLNNGICSTDNGNRTCDCLPGWGGPKCGRPISNAESSNRTEELCKLLPSDYCNAGRCVMDTHIRCQCPGAFTGVRCETRISTGTVTTIASATTTTKQVGNCSQFPCKNGGRCFNTGNTYYCQCYAPYAGTNCENHTG